VRRCLLYGSSDAEVVTAVPAWSVDRVKYKLIRVSSTSEPCTRISAFAMLDVAQDYSCFCETHSAATILLGWRSALPRRLPKRHSGGGWCTGQTKRPGPACLVGNTLIFVAESLSAGTRLHLEHGTYISEMHSKHHSTAVASIPTRHLWQPSHMHQTCHKAQDPDSSIESYATSIHFVPRARDQRWHVKPWASVGWQSLGITLRYTSPTSI
jgi:hypothetical protein